MTRLQPTRTEQAAAPARAASGSIPERLGYRVKRVPLGPPLASAQSHEEKRIEPGSMVRVTGAVGEHKGHGASANPRYELLPSDAQAR